jgi:hypothetical protein
MQLNAEEWRAVKAITHRLLDEIKASGDLAHNPI